VTAEESLQKNGNGQGGKVPKERGGIRENQLSECKKKPPRGKNRGGAEKIRRGQGVVKTRSKRNLGLEVWVWMVHQAVKLRILKERRGKNLGRRRGRTF